MMKTDNIIRVDYDGVWRDMVPAEDYRKLKKDIQELNDRLLDFSLSHLHSSKRDLDKYRELEKKYQHLKSFLYQIDLSPCNGGSCVVATTFDENLDVIKSIHSL